jgi:diacylglycerol kinase (ATP)
MPGKVLFVYNVMSGSGTIRAKTDTVNEAFNRAGKLVTFFRISQSNDMMLREIFAGGGYDTLVVAGGDGTINSVVNDMFHSGANMPLGIIPSGTSNDFAASLGITGSFSKCLDSIINHEPRYVDIAMLNNERYFVGTCAGGIFVNVSYKTSNDFKRALGPTAYYIKALTEVGTFKPFKLEIKAGDGRIFEEEALLFFITNGSHAGGFTQLINKADINDGLMDIVIIKECLNVELVALFFKAVTNNLLDDKNVVHIKAEKCIVSSNKRIVLSVDGEKGDALPVDFEVVPDKLKIFFP